MKLTLMLSFFMLPALVGCRTLPVTGLGNGVYVAVDSHQEDAIEYAKCETEEASDVSTYTGNEPALWGQQDPRSDPPRDD